MRLSFSILLFFAFSHAVAQKNSVCFTIDDLTIVSYGKSDTTFQRSLNNNLLESLVRYKIPAIGFVNEIKLYNQGALQPFQVSLLKSWLDRGFELGNHSFSHFDYNKLTFQAFANEVIKGEKVTKELLAKKGMAIKYFRHPFLHVGNSKAKSDSLETFLSNHGYTVAPVTLDNEEYLFALAYHRAKMKKDQKLAQQIGQDYIIYMEKKLKYFETQCQALFGRNIKHTLLIHANLLNSDYVDELASMFLKNNYEFISLAEALKDPAYKTEVTSFGNWGISWIDRWAMSAGKKKEFFKDEPATPEYIVELTK